MAFRISIILAVLVNILCCHRDAHPKDAWKKWRGSWDLESMDYLYAHDTDTYINFYGSLDSSVYRLGVGYRKYTERRMYDSCKCVKTFVDEIKFSYTVEIKTDIDGMNCLRLTEKYSIYDTNSNLNYVWFTMDSVQLSYGQTKYIPKANGSSNWSFHGDTLEYHSHEIWPGSNGELRKDIRKIYKKRN